MINMALLVIDMQKGLLQRNVFNKALLIDNINQIISEFRNQNLPVFLFRHTNNSFSKLNSEDWQIDEKIKVTDSDIIINKSHSSVFKDKKFKEILKTQKLTDVVIVGLVTNGCIQTACRDAIKLGFSTTLISDGHSTFHKDAVILIPEWNKRLQNEGVNILTTDNFVAM